MPSEERSALFRKRAEILDKIEEIDARMSALEELIDKSSRFPRSVDDVLGQTQYTSAERLRELELEKRTLEIQVERIDEKLETKNESERFAPGELKELIYKYVKRDKCKELQTVPSKVIEKWIREIKASGKTTTMSSVRKALTILGYTKERVKQDK